MREKFREWAEALETFFLEVIFEERRGARAAFVRGVLNGGSKIFAVAAFSTTSASCAIPRSGSK